MGLPPWSSIRWIKKRGLIMCRTRNSQAAVLAAVIGCGAVLAQPTGVRAASPFPLLSGSWSGTGLVRFDQDKSEQIVCRAYYTLKAEGVGLTMAIRCASSSYKIEMRAQLNNQGERVTGQWEERTFNAAGNVNGRASDRNLTLAITGAVSGSMSVAVGQAGHKVDIKTSTGGLAGVSINLTRG